MAEPLKHHGRSASVPRGACSRRFAAVPFAVAAVAALAPSSAWAQTPTAIDSGSTAWMLTSAALVLLMVPGLAMFYGSMVRRKNILTTMMHSFVAMAIIGVQ